MLRGCIEDASVDRGNNSSQTRAGVRKLGKLTYGQYKISRLHITPYASQLFTCHYSGDPPACTILSLCISIVTGVSSDLYSKVFEHYSDL